MAMRKFRPHLNLKLMQSTVAVNTADRKFRPWINAKHSGNRHYRLDRMCINAKHSGNRHYRLNRMCTSLLETPRAINAIFSENNEGNA